MSDIIKSVNEDMQALRDCGAVGERELLPCRQCGGLAKTNDYDVSVECLACEYEEETAETWNANRPITIEQARKVIEDAGCLVVEPSDSLFNAVRGRMIIRREARDEG